MMTLYFSLDSSSISLDVSANANPSFVTSKTLAVILISHSSMTCNPLAFPRTPSISIALISGVASNDPPPRVAPNSLPSATALSKVSSSTSKSIKKAPASNNRFSAVFSVYPLYDCLFPAIFTSSYQNNVLQKLTSFFLDAFHLHLMVASDSSDEYLIVYFHQCSEIF